MSEGQKLKRAKEVMPATTAWLFEEIRANPLLSPFTLIGGSALALHIGHRVSEDLDLITLLPKLPRAALKELERQLGRNGHQITHRIDPAAYDDFQISGLELADSQQDWVVDESVKLKIATFLELCQLKATVTASRSKSRDWLDLFILERDHQFGMAQWKEAFDRAGLTPMHFEIALNRMCEGKPEAGDEGYSSLLLNPPTVDEMQAKFKQLRHEYESTLARTHVINKKAEPGMGMPGRESS